MTLSDERVPELTSLIFYFIAFPLVNIQGTPYPTAPGFDIFSRYAKPRSHFLQPSHFSEVTIFKENSYLLTFVGISFLTFFLAIPLTLHQAYTPSYEGLNEMDTKLMLKSNQQMVMGQYDLFHP